MIIKYYSYDIIKNKRVVSKMDKRKMRIADKFESMFYSNGGMWLELSMKNGDKLYIQRCNKAYFEDLYRESFRVSTNGGSNVEYTFDSLINFFANMGK